MEPKALMVTDEVKTIATMTKIFLNKFFIWISLFDFILPYILKKAKKFCF